MKEVITFGEIMIRLVPPGTLRFTQTHTFELTYGGAEANVAVALANFGIPAGYVTRLPDNDLADACVQTLRGFRVNVDLIVRGGDRMGVYFMETGAAQRGNKVIYDRAGSSMATLEPGMIDWKSVFQNAGWFHFTGISPAISSNAAAATLEAVRLAREAGLTISCDFNLRRNLWKWGKTPAEVIPEMLSYCDVMIGSKEDLPTMLGIDLPKVNQKPGASPAAGEIDPVQYASIVQRVREHYPRLSTLAFTQRGSISANHNTWTAFLWHTGKIYSTTTYDIEPIVDRVGSGDAFTSGLIYGLLTSPETPQRALDFGAAAACLKHSIPGDFNCISIAEVEKLMAGDGSGRVSR
jgi:2-dehydro-3-deoxygluconokinase